MRVLKLVFILGAATTALLIVSEPSIAGLPESSKAPLRDAIREGGKVVIVYQTDKKASAIGPIIASAMRITDPNAIVNKQWVTSIEHRSADDESGCGIIVGKWWAPKAGFMGSDWENRVYEKIQSLVNSISFQYARNGTFENLTTTPGSQGDDLVELCFSN